MAYPFQQPTPQYGLANQANQFMSNQARLPFLMNLPGYGRNTGLRAGNTTSFLQGQVPLDVVQQLQQRGGERGIATGIRGEGPNANASWLRALGLTSLGLMQQGSQQLSQEIKDTPYPPMWSPMALYEGQLKAKQELDAAQGGGASAWQSESQTPWFLANRWTGPAGN